MKCAACGEEVPDLKFCDMCGRSLKEQAAGSVSKVPEPAIPSSVPPPGFGAARAAAADGGLAALYRWQLSLLPDRLDAEILRLTHENITNIVGLLPRLKIGREMAAKGLKQAVLTLTEDLVERGARNNTLGKWVVEILAGAGAVDKFVAMHAGGGRIAFMAAYAHAFAEIDRPDAALALLDSMQKVLQREDWSLYAAVYVRAYDALPINDADIPDEIRLAVADALLDMGKPAQACEVLRKADRSKWDQRDYLKGIRAWYKVNDHVGARERFKEAMARFKIEEAPQLYYEFGRFCENMGWVAQAREIYKQLHDKQGTRCMVDAKTRLANFEALSIHDSKAMDSVLAGLKGDSKAAEAASNKKGLEHKLIQNRYEVIAKLGFGGMGEVYKAKDKKKGLGGRLVAIKRIRDELARKQRVVDQFVEEALTLVHLKHPFIMMLHDVAHDEGEVFLICEFIDGETVQQKLHRDGSLKPERCVGIIIDVCDALTEAHRNSFIHRDLKPDNIMIDHTAHIKLMDFGLARKMNALAGMGGGTPPYMPPEQYEGHESRRSDLYSLGATLYTMLAGRMPFDGDDMRKDKIMERYPALPREIPEDVRAVVTACLRADPEKRPESAQAVAEMLGKTI